MHLKAIMPKVQSRVRYVDHIAGSGREFLRFVCEHDLEGIVGKWKCGTYSSHPQRTSWVKIKNPTYFQAEVRRELFEKRNGGSRRAASVNRSWF
jgi:ATP-dependent DNA ligase